MEKHEGEVFDGVVSSITNWGMYVELPNTVEGMIRITNIKDDYYYYDEEHYELVGETTKRTFRLGQKVKIVVTGTDRLQRQIDFELYEEESENEQ